MLNIDYTMKIYQIIKLLNVIRLLPYCPSCWKILRYLQILQHTARGKGLFKRQAKLELLPLHLPQVMKAIIG